MRIRSLPSLPVAVLRASLLVAQRNPPAPGGSSSGSANNSNLLLKERPDSQHADQVRQMRAKLQAQLQSVGK